jgi:hypothetical protein
MKKGTPTMGKSITIKPHEAGVGIVPAVEKQSLLCARRRSNKRAVEPEKLVRAILGREAGSLAVPSLADARSAAWVLAGSAGAGYNGPVVPEPLTGRTKVLPGLHRDPVGPWTEDDRLVSVMMAFAPPL